MKSRGREQQPSPGENVSDQDDIARRAYELYEARGSEPGHELEDWLAAEREIHRQRGVAQSG